MFWQKLWFSLKHAKNISEVPKMFLRLVERASKAYNYQNSPFKKVIVFSLGYAKTYQKALKVALGRPIRHQISKITKIFILIKVMVFTWACKNITEGPKGTLGLPLGRQRCKVPIYPFQQKTWFLQWYGKTYLESQKCLWLANKASKMQNYQNTHVNKSYGFCMGMQKYIKSP